MKYFDWGGNNRKELLFEDLVSLCVTRRYQIHVAPGMTLHFCTQALEVGPVGGLFPEAFGHTKCREILALEASDGCMEWSGL